MDEESGLAFRIVSWQDDDRYPKVIVSVGEGGQETLHRVNLYKSIKMNLSASCLEIIKIARWRYTDAALRGPSKPLNLPPSRVGKAVLNRLHEAYMDGIEERRKYNEWCWVAQQDMWATQAAEELAEILKMTNDLKNASFEKRLRIIRDSFVSKHGYYGNDDEKPTHASIYIWDVDKFIDYLREAYRLRRITTKALKNALLGHFWRMDQRSVSSKLSLANKKVREAKSSKDRAFLPPWFTHGSHDEDLTHPLSGLVYDTFPSS